MKRRDFFYQGSLLTGGCLMMGNSPSLGSIISQKTGKSEENNSYQLFKDPDSIYYPFVRWWWNGDKVEIKELVRELRLLHEAKIGGVEINPIEFPSRIEGDDLGKPSITWLSDKWITMLKSTFDEAKDLDLTCDLIVGSGWPFGSETLKRDERAQVIVLDAEKLEGPRVYETSQFNIFKNIDPGVTVPCPSRSFKIISMKLVPDLINCIDDAIDLSDKCEDKIIHIDVPEGKYFLYTLVKVDSFACVINGAPGAAGPILDHMNKAAVRKYLDHMSDTIQNEIGPLSNYLRAFFTDSMELEGSNWTDDFEEEFKKRRGYDVMPYLSYIMFKTGRLGDVSDYRYGSTKTPEFTEIINRVRFDFELTKAELLYERFTKTYLQWCKDQHVKSRAQSYGRGFFTLESSLMYDIPEGESWTTNWLRHRLGEEMSDDDYRRGRGYTMIDKYVSSAAHLSGKREVSCEEMTNTYLVFSTPMELLKIGSDQSIMSGITHSIWHGFNYSPPDVPFPGWIQYGSYYNEKNTWWPYFKYLNTYKARISSLLENADMYTDIAILPANNDMWSEMGVQTDPFPSKLNVEYTSLIWESINKTGGGVDYITEIIINGSEIKSGKLCYGNKKYGIIFLPGVKSIEPSTIKKLYKFVSEGGRIFCIDTYPEKSLGLLDAEKHDKEVTDLVKKLKIFSDRFILLKKPIDNRFLEWYEEILKQYSLPQYLKIEKPNRFVMQNRYQSDDQNEIIFFANAHKENTFTSKITFSEKITRRKYGWIWVPDTGKRYRIQLEKHNSFQLTLGPAQSIIFVFDHHKNGPEWKAIPFTGSEKMNISKEWDLEFKHCQKRSVSPASMQTLKDLQKVAEYSDFAGTIIYRKKIEINGKIPDYLNLGKVYGVSELILNGQNCGIKWYGNRIYPVTEFMKEGINDIEIRVTTVLGNYMKSLKDNKVAQLWTNRPHKEQKPSSMGMVGPVAVYCDKKDI